MTCDALSQAAPEQKDLELSHNIKVEPHFHTLLLGFYSMNLFSGDDQDTQIERELELCPVFQFSCGKTVLTVKCASFVIKMCHLKNGYDALSARMIIQHHPPFSTWSSPILLIRILKSFVIEEEQLLNMDAWIPGVLVMSKNR